VLARTVALKTIELAFVVDEATRAEFERRFFTEARVAARLAHPGIVVCHDVGKDAASGKLFIVFEYLKGRTLAERVAEGPMEWRDALRVVVQVARAIHHAHVHGVVHRDLKPANVMLLDPTASGASGGRAEAAVKIMDFGVARLESLGERLTKTGQSFGSPLYTSPEQAMGQPSSVRSDIFSLGSVLCTLLLGRPWFDAPTVARIVDRVVHDDAPQLSTWRPDVPPALDVVMGMTLAKRAADRYATAAEMADDLEDVLAGRPPKHATGVDPLAALLDEATLPEAPPTSVAAATAAAPADPTMPLGAAAPVAPAARWRSPLPAVALLGLAAVAAGAFFLYRPSPAVDPVPPSSVAVHPSASPTPVVSQPATPAPAAPATTAPTTPPTEAPTPSPTAVPAAAATPRERPAGSLDGAEDGAAPSAAATGSRIRLSLEHPFESGRLIVWIDGVLVHEEKLQASGSKRIVAFKVREGRAEKLLDVSPGPHEVRVQVTWDQGRSEGTKVIDVAPQSTGLLEVRVGRMSKDVNLQWSRLTKE
jgi:hypothetical protein